MSESQSTEMTVSKADARIMRIAQQILGCRLATWEIETNPKLCRTLDRNHKQLSAVIDLLQDQLDKLILGEIDFPDIVHGRDSGSREMTEAEKEGFRSDRITAIGREISANVATLEKLTAVYLKLTGGGMAGIMASATKTFLIDRSDAVADIRDASPTKPAPRRHFGAGEAHVIEAEVA